MCWHKTWINFRSFFPWSFSSKYWQTRVNTVLERTGHLTKETGPPLTSLNLSLPWTTSIIRYYRDECVYHSRSPCEQKMDERNHRKPTLHQSIGLGISFTISDKKPESFKINLLAEDINEWGQTDLITNLVFHPSIISFLSVAQWYSGYHWNCVGREFISYNISFQAEGIFLCVSYLQTWDYIAIILSCCNKLITTCIFRVTQ